MTEPASQPAPAQAQSRSPESGNVFTRKLGPLPMWAWMGIGLAVALGYYFWKNNLSSSGSSTPNQTTASSQVPQFVNQTYVQGTPPVVAPGPPPPPGPRPGPGPYKLQFTKTNGKETLAEIAKHVGTTVPDLIADTIDHPGNVNKGKFTSWLHHTNMGKTGKVPAGYTLYYTPGGHGAVSGNTST